MITKQEIEQWLSELTRLADFEKTGSGDGDWRWKCGDPGTQDRLGLSKQAAASLSLPHEQLMAIVRQHAHVCCDCEILFNFDREEAR